jgi:hypothetical protein
MSKFARCNAAVLNRLTLDLTFEGEKRKKTEKIAMSLSGVDWYKGYIFVGSDEGPGFERLKEIEEGVYRARARFELGDFFDLPGDPDDEADVESISIHKNWLWLVTSHARTRPKLEDGVEKFAKVQDHPRRYVLGRIPLVDGAGEPPTPVRRDSNREAWCVPVSGRGSALIDAIAEDPHLKQSLKIPAKENGLDIEGLAVGNGRLVLGLRGPVLRGQAVLLSLNWPEDERRTPSKDGAGVKYRKIFVDLHGLGVRDLCRRNQDLVILAGPTMPVPATYCIYLIPDFFEKTDMPDVLEPRYWCDVPSEEGRNPEGLSTYGDDADQFIMVLDGGNAAKGVVADALLIRGP